MPAAAKTPSAAARSAALAALTALSVSALPAAPAHAWGEGEQNFLAGVVTAVVVDQMLTHSRKTRGAEAYGGHHAPYAAPDPVREVPEYRSTPTSVHATPAARAFNSYSAAERKAIQRRLRAEGYYAGGIDGAFGPRTYNAVLAYASDMGATGTLRTTGGAFAVFDGLIF